jgi:GGDEF domain-containing protein
VLESPVILGGRSLLVRASVGVALFPEHGTDLDALLQRADMAMYAAKRLPPPCSSTTTNSGDIAQCRRASTSSRGPARRVSRGLA